MKRREKRETILSLSSICLSLLSIPNGTNGSDGTRPNGDGEVLRSVAPLSPCPIIISIL